jgi:hypothetical protein
MVRRTRRIASACFALAALSTGSAAAQTRCAPAPEPSIRLELKQPKPALGTASMAELRQMSRDGLGEHEQALGLYKGELRAGLRLQFSNTTHGGQACLVLREASIEVELADRRILLARELKRGTCRYDVTLAHEQLHARIDDTMLARELPKMKVAIARAAQENGAVGPIRAVDVDSYREDYGERLQRVFRREVERIGGVRRHEQSQIDTPESYKREAERCPGGLAVE